MDGGYTQDDRESSSDGDWIVQKLYGHLWAQEHISARLCLIVSQEDANK